MTIAQHFRDTLMTCYRSLANATESIHMQIRRLDNNKATIIHFFFIVIVITHEAKLYTWCYYYYHITAAQ